MAYIAAGILTLGSGAGIATAAGGPTMSADPAFGGGSQVSLTFPVTPGCASTSFKSVGGTALQADGKVVIVGYANGFNCGSNPASEVVIARLTSAGALDTTFGAGHTGYVQIVPSSFALQFQAQAIGIEPDNQKIVVGGLEKSGANQYVLIARLGTDGTPDPGFGTNGVFVDTSTTPDSATALAFDANSKILVAGDGGDLRRYTASPTALDWQSPSFLIGGNGSPGAQGIAVQSDGKIVVAGTSYPTPENHDYGIVARVTATGGMDATFGSGGCPNVVVGCSGISPPGGGESVLSLDLQDAKIVVSGTGTDHGLMVARLDSAGQLDPTFATAGRLDIPPPTGFSSSSANGVLFDPYPGIIILGGGTRTNSSQGQFAFSADPDGKSFSNGTITLPDGRIRDATGKFDPASQTLTFSGTDANGNPVSGKLVLTESGSSPPTPPPTDDTPPPSDKPKEHCPPDAAPADLPEDCKKADIAATRIRIFVPGLVGSLSQANAGSVATGDEIVLQSEEVNRGPFPAITSGHWDGSGCSAPLPDAPAESLSPGAGRYDRVTCTPTSDVNLTFSAFGSLADPDTSNNSRTVSLYDVTQPAASVTSADAHGAAGTASTGAPHRRAAAPHAALQRLARVQVGVRRREQGGCRWLKNGRGQFSAVATKAQCNKPTWLSAKGTRRWRIRYSKPLPTGSYELFVRAINRGGVATHRLTSHDHVKFRV